MSKIIAPVPKKTRFRGVKLPDDHDRQLRYLAADLNCSCSDIMRDALVQYLDKLAKRPSTV